MNNRGQITVFLSLLLVSLLILITAAVEITGTYTNKARVAQASKGACESVKADYNTYIFDQYHLLLLDKTYSGKGEAYLETVIQDYLEYTYANQDLSVSDVALTASACVLDDDCANLKEQINDYMPTYLAATAVESLVDGLIDSDTASSVADAINEGKNEEIEEESSEDTDSEDTTSEDSSSSTKDIRKTLKNLLNKGLLTVVLPSGKSVSDAEIDTSELPSKDASISSSDDEEVDTKFKNIDKLESTISSTSSLTAAIESTDIYGVEYALAFFNCFTDGSSTETVLSCEVEYLIAGKASDQDNLLAVTNRIVLHRLPINMAALLLDTTKMAQVEALATSISSLTLGTAYGAIKYLIVACWAYGETLVEVRALLAGKSIPLVKNKSNWNLSLENFAKLESITSTDYEGLDAVDYEDFLRLFLYEKSSSMYYRMADLMEVNAKQGSDSFKMKNCIYAFSVDLTSSDGTNEYSIAATTSY